LKWFDSQTRQYLFIAPGYIDVNAARVVTFSAYWLTFFEPTGERGGSSAIRRDGVFNFFYASSTCFVLSTMVVRSLHCESRSAGGLNLAVWLSELWPSDRKAVLVRSTGPRRPSRAGAARQIVSFSCMRLRRRWPVFLCGFRLILTLRAASTSGAGQVSFGAHLQN
jgi:hypothetical protein